MHQRNAPLRQPLLLAACLCLGLSLPAIGSDPIFQDSDLLGTQTEGTRVRTVNGSGLSNIDQGEALLSSGTLPGSGNGLFPTVNFGGAGSFGGTVPYPAGTTPDQFGFEASGLLNIPSAGDYVLGVSSDDGFRLRLGTGLDTASEFVGPTGNSNTRVVVAFDQPGLVPYRLTHFEAGGGEFVEFYAKPGTNTALDLSADRLIGDTANGGLQSLAAGQFFIRDLKAPGIVNNLAGADALLRGAVTPTLETTAFTGFVDFLDGGGGANYSNNLPFPGGAGRDDFALEATAMIFIPSAGTYTFNNNSDDGGRIQIQGQRVLNSDFLQAPTNSFGSITFDAPGLYDLRYTFFERGGGAGAELAVAQGVHTSFDANQFRLVGDVANGGLAVFSPKGWKHDASGNFSDASNWRDGQVAGGAGAFASFSLVDLTADRTVTIDAPTTLGHVRFGDVDETGGAGGWTVSGAGSLELAPAGSNLPVIEVLNGRTTFDLPITGAAGMKKQGDGTLVLATSPTYTGDTVIRQGAIELDGGDLPSSTILTLGEASHAGTLVLNGNSQTVAGLRTGGDAVNANRVVNSSATPATLTVDSPTAQVDRFSGTLGGPGANENNFGLTKQGAGTLQLTSPSTYTGDTVIAGGTVQLGWLPGVTGASLWLDASNPDAVQAAGGQVTAWLDQSGNGRDATPTGATAPTATTSAAANGLGVINFDGTNQILGVDLSFLAGSDYTIFAAEGRTGTGNHYFLGTTPGAGNRGLHVGYRNNTGYTLAQFGNDLNLGVPGYSGQEFRVWTNELDSSSGHAIYLNGAFAASNTNTTPLSTADDGRIGSGFSTQWYQGDLGELILFDRALTPAERNDIEAYLAAKWLLGAISSSDILPVTTNLRIGSGGTLELQGTSQSVASLADHAGAGGTISNLVNGAATFTTGSGGGDHTFSGSFVDATGSPLSFVKTGPGTQTLSGTSNYSGTTTVEGGTLLINGDHSGASGDVTVQSGATLGGTGVIGGATLIHDGGFLSPGNSAGTITFANTLTLNPGATLLADVLFGGGATDLVVVSDDVLVGGATLDGTWGGSSANVFSGDYSAESMFWLIDNQDPDDDPISGIFANTVANPGFAGLFGNVATPYMVSFGGQLFAAFYESQFGVFSQAGLTGGNDLLLIAVPEPSRPLLLAAALAPLLLRRRRHRS